MSCRRSRVRFLLLAACLPLAVAAGARADDLEMVGKPLRGEEPTFGVLVAPDGLSVVVRRAKTCRLVDPLSGKDIGKELELPPGNAVVAYSEDGKSVVAFTRNKEAAQEVRVWNAATGEALGPPIKFERAGPALRPQLVAGGKSVLAFTSQRGARLYDVASGQPAGEAFDVPQGTIRALVAPDGVTAVFLTSTGEYRRFDLRTGKQLGEALRIPEGRTMVFAPLGQQVGLRFSPDGQRLVGVLGTAKSVGFSGTCELTAWDVATGKAVSQVGPPALSAWVPFAVGGDGGRVAVGGDGRSATVYDLATGKAVVTVKHEAGRPRGSFPVFPAAVRLSPDGTLLATSAVRDPVPGRPDAPLGEVRLWDAATGAPVGKPLTFRNPVHQLAFTQDGKYLLLGAVGRDPSLDLEGGLGGAFLEGNPRNNEATLWKIPERMAPKPK